MKALRPGLNLVVAAFAAFLCLCPPAMAGTDKLDALFSALKGADAEKAQSIQTEIEIEWSRSGSAAMDLLLERGEEALAMGDLDSAIGHLSALIDHAPDFPEGWNQRAIAYYQRGDIGLAVEDISHVLALEPRHYGALAGLGAIFEDLGRPNKALEVYRAVLTIHPHAPGVAEAIERLEAEAQGSDL